MALSKVDLANQVENDLPQSLIANNVNFMLLYTYFSACKLSI